MTCNRGWGLGVVALSALVLASGCGDGVVAERGAAAGAPGAGEEGIEPTAMAGSASHGGAGNIARDDGGAGEVGAIATVPTPARVEPCSGHDDPMTVAQGTLGDTELDHGFCNIEIITGSFNELPAADVAFGDDGYLHARWSDSEKIETGLLRLPRSAASDGGWYCIEQGTATHPSTHVLRLELTSLSRLDLENAAIDAAGSVTGSIGSEQAWPLSAGGYTQLGFGQAFIQLPVEADPYGPTWLLLAFKPYPDGQWPDPTKPYSDVVLVDYGDAGSPLRVALPGPGSTVMREEDAKQDVIDTKLDLHDVTKPVACPGAKVDGKLVVYFHTSTG